jgi:hypothetical protein
MGVCWQSTGDSSSKPKNGSNRLTNNLIISSQLNNNNNNNQNNNTNNHQDYNHNENLEKKIGKINNIDNQDSTLFDLSFEESVKNFPDMPEIELQIMKGYGIKQMPGYKCDLKIDQLNKKRD